MPSFVLGLPVLVLICTQTHTSVVDHDGMAVALTSTVNVSDSLP